MSFRQFNRLAAKLCLFDLKGIKGLRLKCKTVSGVRMGRYGHHRLGCRAMKPSDLELNECWQKSRPPGAGPLARSVCPVASNLVGELVHAGFELRDPAARRPPAANLTADNKMTRKPNFALNEK